jgi:4'-phosphopantetheinyl transferase EntD
VTPSLRDLLPISVAVSERVSAVAADTLLDEERVFSAKSIPRRRAEFATGRHCARTALAELGVSRAAQTPIKVGSHRQPIWPPGIVGSITHCEGHFAAAVAPSSAIRALGIDVEQHAPIPAAVTAATSWPDELEALSQEALSSSSSAHWPAVLFSARESVFKAWYPIVGQWLGHHDVRLSIDLASGALEITFLEAAAELAETYHLTTLEGAVRWNELHVFSAVWQAVPQP